MAIWFQRWIASTAFFGASAAATDGSALVRGRKKSRELVAFALLAMTRPRAKRNEGVNFIIIPSCLPLRPNWIRDRGCHIVQNYSIGVAEPKRVKQQDAG